MRLWRGTIARSPRSVYWWFVPKRWSKSGKRAQAFVQHYNQERPNQALSCGNRPPYVAFPALPSLPPVPGFVDPDAWLRHIDGAHFIRKVRSNGSVLIDDVPYYLKHTLSGQYVDVCVYAAQQELVVWHWQQPIKRLPIKGLKQSVLTFEQFVAFMAQEALSEHRRLLQARRRASPPAASGNERRNLMPNHLLQWEAMRWAKAQGATLYDLWGIADSDDPAHPEAGLSGFKRGWGGQVITYIGTFDYVYAPTPYLCFRGGRAIRQQVTALRASLRRRGYF